MDKKSNTEIWHHQRHLYINLEKTIEKICKEILDLQKYEKIVDLGCGECPYEYIFKKFGCEYITCDIDGNPSIHIEEGKPIPLENNFANGVVSFQVLEHVWDLNWYLGNSYRILKKNGWLLLSTHGSWPYHPHPHDYRRWTREGLIKEIEQYGFKVEKVFPVVGLLALTTQFRLLAIYVLFKKIPFIGNILFMPIAIIMNLLMILEDKITPGFIKENNASVYVTLSRKI